METQPIVQPLSPKKFPVAAVLISVVLTAIIVGGGVYFWQNMQLKEAEVTAPEVTPIQTTTVKPTVTSPRSGETIGRAFGGVRITGKAAPNSSVWLFEVPEMDPGYLGFDEMLTGAERVDTSGNFEIIYTPFGEAESWPSEFSVVSLDQSQKYGLIWSTSKIFVPTEAKSDYFQLILKP